MNLEKKNPRLSRWFWILLLFVCLFFLIQVGLCFLQVLLLKNTNPHTSAFMQYYLKHCQREKSACLIEQSWRSLDEISPYLQEAVLIGEDDAFFEHEGIDLDAMQESIELNLKKKRFIRGGSTITQQLAKNLYLSSSKNPLRKIKEILIALFMEKILDKERILEIYLNVIEWGKGIYGAEAASNFYFHKPARDLNREEAAYLAAIIPNPVSYASRAHNRRAMKRKGIILRRMGSRTTSPPQSRSWDIVP